MNLASALGGHYAIERELGRGAMATVYLARDLKHSRDVAIKVLSPQLAEVIGAERFLREIDVVSRLHHPHILPLFDSGASDGVLFYVMPRVGGESLQQRLRREKQLPIPVALQLTREIAGALDFAHRHGVIHRDIKPGNILLQDGQALVADFGVALTASAAGTDRLTSLGISLGTPGYMSPEQAAGEDSVDARSDVYSLGCVLYEMLGGEPPITGRTNSVIVARTVHEVPRPIRELRSSVPVRVERALQRAMEKLPADRFGTSTEFARALDAPESGGGLEAQAIIENEPQGGRKILIAIVGIAGFAAVVALAAYAPWSSSESRRSASVTRWDIMLPDSAPLIFVGTAELGVGRSALAISPSGRRLAYVARYGASTQLFTRNLSELESKPIPGTFGAHQPIFSPDGEWLAFFAEGELRKVPVSGGQALTLARVGHHLGGAWAADGRILVAESEGRRLSWISATGGPPQPIPVQLPVRVHFPELLPGDEWITHGSLDRVLYVSSLRSGEAYALTRDSLVLRSEADIGDLLYGTNPRYVGSGHIIYFAAGNGVLMALPFDSRSRRVVGRPVPVLEGVRRESSHGGGQLSVSSSGTLVYAPGEDARKSYLAWVHRSGQIDTLPFPRAVYGPVDVAPDDRRILVRVESDIGRPELLVLNRESGVQRRIPTGGIPSYWPSWTPDGTRILQGDFDHSGVWRGPVFSRSANDPADVDTILAIGAGAIISPDGRLIVSLNDPMRSPGLWIAPITGSPREARQLVHGAVAFPSFSPDGRWIAHTEMVAGRYELYVTSTSDPPVRHKISMETGEEPRWSPLGNEVFYRNGQQWLVVEVSAAHGFSSERPEVMFEGAYLQAAGWSYDVSADGRRFLVLLGPPQQSTERLVAVTNWFDELQRLAPARQ